MVYPPTQSSQKEISIDALIPADWTSLFLMHQVNGSLIARGLLREWIQFSLTSLVRSCSHPCHFRYPCFLAIVEFKMGNYLETAPMARELIDFRKGGACHSYTCSHDRKAGPEFVPRTATVALRYSALLALLLFTGQKLSQLGWLHHTSARRARQFIITIIVNNNNSMVLDIIWCISQVLRFYAQENRTRQNYFKRTISYGLWY